MTYHLEDVILMPCKSGSDAIRWLFVMSKKKKYCLSKVIDVKLFSKFKSIYCFRLCVYVCDIFMCIPVCILCSAVHK